jgi:hypothetical protein
MDVAEKKKKRETTHLPQRAREFNNTEKRCELIFCENASPWNLNPEPAELQKNRRDPNQPDEADRTTQADASEGEDAWRGRFLRLAAAKTEEHPLAGDSSWSGAQLSGVILQETSCLTQYFAAQQASRNTIWFNRFY